MLSLLNSQERTGSQQLVRVRIALRGAVQGVGFRPFVFRLATELGLSGWVSNSSQGAVIDVEATKEIVNQFRLRLERELPPPAFIYSLEPTYLDPAGHTSFAIRSSDESGAKTALVLPDLATCAACLRDIFDAGNRRYRYPFTNCTHCGPRFSIIEALPYDRHHTTMKRFRMCASCQTEYDDPHDRRFHAQPNACPECGPHLELWDRHGRVVESHDNALRETGAALRGGKIVAVKGLGGFHLMCDARSAAAVCALREFKGREEKPFALMFPSLDAVRRCCEVADREEQLLTCLASPIVLLRRRVDCVPEITDAVAPRNPYLGVMLPYTPLHHLLLSEFGFPVVATSGNLAEEPICVDEHEALERLAGFDGLFLVHNRPIVRHVDDSIVRIMMGRELVLRRARGYAPLPIHMPEMLPAGLAVGAHVKNAVAMSSGQEVFVSQHIGDMDTVRAVAAFRRVIADFQQLYEHHPEFIACDLHPDYRSTQYAQSTGLPVVMVQHHYAHVLACMAENELEGSLLGICWDGTGYGLDGTVWGGEYLYVTDAGFHRAAHLRAFPLPGGEQAVREPRRAALGVLYALLGESAFNMNDLAPVASFTAKELALLRAMLQRRLNVPLTSSVGRLFDAVASLLELRQITRYEGQAAGELECSATESVTDGRYEFEVQELPGQQENASLIIDWAPLMRGILKDLAGGIAKGSIAAKFHNALVESIVAVARRIGADRVVLTGGCFQNRYLTERAIQRLRDEGFRSYWHQRIPPNDGGLAVGQLMAAARQQRTKER